MDEHQAEMGPDAPEAEPTSLREENARLRAKVARSRHGSDLVKVRTVISVVLTVVGVVAVAVGVYAAWFQTTIVDQDRFVETFAPFPQDEAIATYLAERIADELMVETEAAQRIESRLPDELSFLTVPLTQGVHTLVVSTSESLISSEFFAAIWRGSLRVAPTTASAVLATGGEISIDLNEAANVAVERLEDRGFAVFSDVDIEIPEIVLFQDEGIEQAAGVVAIVNTLGWLVPLTAVGLLAVAVLVAPSRLKATQWIGFSTAIGLLLVLVARRFVMANALAKVSDEPQREAIEAGWQIAFAFYVQTMWAVILLATILGTTAWVAGSSPRAQEVLAWVTQTLDQWRAGSRGPSTSGVAGSTATWRRPLEWGLLAVGLVALLVVPTISGWLVITVTIVVLVGIAIIEMVSGPPDSRQDRPAEPHITHI